MRPLYQGVNCRKGKVHVVVLIHTDRSSTKCSNFYSPTHAISLLHRV
jgi:hypothetical protein